MAKVEIIGEVVRDSGILHVVVADHDRAKRWGGAEHKAHVAALQNRHAAVVGKDKALALVDLGGAGQALAISVPSGITLAAYYPNGKVSASVRKAVADAAAGDPIKPEAAAHITIASGFSFGWAFDALASSDSLCSSCSEHPRQRQCVLRSSP